jgi:hypothetical protein
MIGILAFSGFIYFGNQIITIPTLRWTAWNETYPICVQFCKSIGGVYSNHEVIFGMTNKMTATGANCECKNIGGLCVANYCYSGDKKTFAVMRQWK